MRILIIDNTMDRQSWGADELRRLARRSMGNAAAGATLVVRRAPQGDLPSTPRGFDRIILSGSKTSALENAPWVSELHEFTQKALNESVPLLGVCYGHQTLATVLGGSHTCHRAKTAEYGWTKIELTARAPLLDGLPGSFYSFSAHTDEIRSSLPAGTRALARSNACAIQAFQLGDRPVYGIQFHPERDLTGAQQTFREIKREKSLKSKEALLHSNRSAELYDPKIGETIFKNFIGG